MRIPLKLMSLTAALTIVPLISAQSTKSAKKPSFSIAINAPEDIVKADSSVPLDIILTNTSDKDTSSGEILGGAELNYDIDVRGSKGELAPETSFGRKLHHKEPGFTLGGSVVAYYLKPGRTHETRSYLNRVYVAAKPAAVLADERSAGETCPVVPVAIPGDGAGDQSAGSPGVKAFVGKA